MTAAVVLLLGCCVDGAAAQRASALWGESGERWTPASRLPEFSWAGYRSGDAPIPDVKAAASVKDFGAAGDGKTDDAKAIQAAIDKTAAGAIEIPAGRYVLGDVVTIRKSGIVLRGAGAGKTIFVIPRSLEQIRGPRPDGKMSAYAFGGAFVMVEGADDGKHLADVVAAASRGERTIIVNNGHAITPGTWVRVRMSADPALGRLIHGNLHDAAPKTADEMQHFMNWAARVVAVDGPKLTIDRPLRLDVNPAWGAQIHSFAPTVHDVGIEGITFEFAGTVKRDHLYEEGFNAIEFRGVSDGWVRDVTTIDADNAINVVSSRFCTFENIVCKTAKRSGVTGHHALWVRRTQDCLFTGFKIQTQFVHDLSVEGLAHGTVFEKGSGQSLNFDHHRNAPYENLFTDLDVGDPQRLFKSGGAGDRGPNTGARETIWGLRYRGGGKLPKLPNWPLLNVIGVRGYEPRTEQDGAWVEPDVTMPKNLYEAQLAARRRAGER